MDKCLQSINKTLLDTAKVGEGDHVLDIGSGCGQPALLASLRVGPSGSVNGVDVAEDILQVARRKAVALG